ncbi:MAG: CoB--CoM heterodisulfide reductase iron-sulfur subunit A family protein [Deltaproteobacteria bacterium]|nr:CoB--CoM heterodisulfide reductase iron-sulfur subunit A family protein [Deltaproteobacteria bacterium]MBW2134841.1 CoB--CoM heterodisulfide reductase iron-sulfur subunit A family protein [Deltaproteobacteria bacterium]
MAKDKLLICHCPDLTIDVQALIEWLERSGQDVQLLPPLCTPEGLAQLHHHLSTAVGKLLIGACGPERYAGLFRLLVSKAELAVVDLLACNDLETAVGALTLAQAAPHSLEPTAPPLSREVLIVGGGIGGCQAALDLAKAGIKVYLVDAALSIGGIMAQLDKTFPTLDCSICILGPKLVEVAAHPQIELLTYVNIERITGAAGAFEVDLTLKPRYVDMTKCVGCGTCTEVCPIIVPGRWDLDLKPSKCIRISFAQAVPLRAAIDKEYCIDCQLCVKACERQAINLEDEPQPRHLTVGAIILATGARPFDPTIKSEYGYGRIPTVITNLEYERIVCASGPTQGLLITPEGRAVQRIAFIQCVGSRDRRFLPYCSGYCCTASIKEAMLALEHQPEAEVTIFYNDIRTSGKGFEELYQRARQAGVNFIKGLPGRIQEDDHGRPVISYENQLTGVRAQLTADLVVLAVGLEAPKKDLPFVGPAPDRDELGFYQCRQPVLHPLESTRPGVFLAGTCQGPQDITTTVCQGSAVAARVLNMFGSLAKKASRSGGA